VINEDSLPVKKSASSKQWNITAWWVWQLQSSFLKQFTWTSIILTNITLITSSV